MGKLLPIRSPNDNRTARLTYVMFVDAWPVRFGSEGAEADTNDCFSRDHSGEIAEP